MRTSFIIPTYNRADVLEECVHSILEHKIDGWEVIIADDGSTDTTERVCSRLQCQYGAESLKVERCMIRSGAQVARNRGVKVANGKFLMFVDSDDVVLPQGVKQLDRKLQKESELDYVFGKVIITDEKLNPIVNRRPVGSAFSNVPVEVAGYHWHTMGAMYRRSYLEKVGPWNIALTGSQDWEFQARVKLSGGRGEFVDTFVGFWRQHAGERVGTLCFRPDYVRSVMVACDSILYKSRSVGKCDAALERRLARKLFVHALEWGANGCHSERSECLEEAWSCLSNDRLLRVVLKLIRISPTFADRWLLSRLKPCG